MPSAADPITKFFARIDALCAEHPSLSGLARALHANDSALLKELDCLHDDARPALDRKQAAMIERFDRYVEKTLPILDRRIRQYNKVLSNQR